MLKYLKNILDINIIILNFDDKNYEQITNFTLDVDKKINFILRLSKRFSMDFRTKRKFN